MSIDFLTDLVNKPGNLVLPFWQHDHSTTPPLTGGGHHDEFANSIQIEALLQEIESLSEDELQAALLVEMQE